MSRALLTSALVSGAHSLAPLTTTINTNSFKTITTFICRAGTRAIGMHRGLHRSGAQRRYPSFSSHALMLCPPHVPPSRSRDRRLGTVARLRAQTTTGILPHRSGLHTATHAFTCAHTSCLQPMITEKCAEYVTTRSAQLTCSSDAPTNQPPPAHVRQLQESLVGCCRPASRRVEQQSLSH